MGKCSCSFINIRYQTTVKPVLSGHSKIDKTKIFMKNDDEGRKYCRMLPCNTFDLHKAIIGLKTIIGLLLEWSLKTGYTVIINNKANMR